MINIFALRILAAQMLRVIVCGCLAGRQLVIDFMGSGKRYMQIFHRMLKVHGPVRTCRKRGPAPAYGRKLTRWISLAPALLLLTLILSPVQAGVPIISQLAEHGKLVGLTVAKTIPGFKGSGYVTGFTKPGNLLIVTFHIPASGLYDAIIRYSSPGQKGFALAINGSQYSSMFPTSPNHFSNFDAGLVELKTGKNVVSIGRGWGYFSIDSITFMPTRSPPPPMRPSPHLSDPSATPQARSLMSHLVEVYGRRMLTGVYTRADANYVHQVSGHSPSIIGGDLIDYSPTRLEHGANPHHEVQKLIRDARDGYILTVSWHWNAPAQLIDHSYVNAQGKTVQSH